MSRDAILNAGLALAYGVALALLLDPHLMPGLIAAAYREESWGTINRILAGRSQWPLEYYLSKWHGLARGLAVAVFGSAAATLAARLGWGRSRRVALLAALAPALSCAAVLAGPLNDYVAYAIIWDRTLAGGDPWAFDRLGADGPHSSHAYGPLFNLLAIPAALDPLAPKVLLALTWAAILASLADRAPRITLALGPLAAIDAVHSGAFDHLVGLCLLATLRARRDGRDLAAGAWLGIGFLLKFLPIVTLPFLVLDGRRLRWRLAASALVIAAGGLGLSMLIWGPIPAIRPLAFASKRPSEYASAFAFARVGLGVDLDAWSRPVIAAALFALACWSVWRRPDPVPTALAAIGLVLAFYKHGSIGYPIMLIVPVAWLVSQGARPGLQRAALLYASWAALLYTAFIILYAKWPSRAFDLARRAFPDEQSLEFLKVAAGVPGCLVTLILVAALLRQARPGTGLGDRPSERADRAEPIRHAVRPIARLSS